MKIIIALLALAVVAASANQIIINDATLSKVKDVSKGCEGKSHVEVDTIKRLRTNELLEDGKLKDYLHCIFTEMNWVNGASFNIEEFKKALKPDLPFDVVEPCSHFRSTGPQLSYNVYKCVGEHIGEGYQQHL